MTKPGIYTRKDGAHYRVLFNARNSTKGEGEGRDLVVYIDLATGWIHAMDEEQFNGRPPFSCFNTQLSDADAESLYDSLCELVGRTPAP